MAWAERAVVLCLVVAACGCRSRDRSSARAEPLASPAAAVSSAPPAVTPPPPPPPLDAKSYPWLPDAPSNMPKAVETLHSRFAEPPGWARAKLGADSFGAWLRELPLAEAKTPVRAYDGRELHAAEDPRIAAVIALDVSPVDLQQCADTVVRLHAEWLWSRGRRDMSYRAASGLDLPWSRWQRGERLVATGPSIQWVPGSASRSDHQTFRKYLDAVFAWANTVSLDKQAKPVNASDVAPGDFFILPGNPGHAVLVLDVAVRGDDRRALLGQSYMPAQNAQVLRNAAGSPWFVLDPNQKVDTPFWKPFPWGSLRRLDG